MCNHQKYHLLQLIFSFKLLNEEYTSNNCIFEKYIHIVFFNLDENMTFNLTSCHYFNLVKCAENIFMSYYWTAKKLTKQFFKIMDKSFCQFCEYFYESFFYAQSNISWCWYSIFVAYNVMLHYNVWHWILL